MPKIFSVSSQDDQPYSVAFNSDQSKMWIVGNNTAVVYQYTLSTPGDVSTASYASKSFDVSIQEATPYGVAFNSDQSKMWVIGTTNNTVYQYTLSTPGDVSTASIVDSFSVSAQETQATGIAFNSDQSAMWIVGQANDTVYQYTLSTPGTVSSASYDSKSVATGESAPTSIAFSTDLAKLFVIGATGDAIRYFSLSTAGDVSTASFVSLLTTSPFDVSMSGIAFNSAGTSMWICGTSTDAVYQYTLSTGYDLSTATPPVSAIYSDQATTYGLAFNSDQSKMWLAADATIYQYTLSTAADLLTASYASKSYSVTEESTVRGVTFNSDQSKMWLCGHTNATVYQYTLSTPGDVSTASYDTKSFSVSGQATQPQQLQFNSDQSKMWVMDSMGSAIYQYTLSTPGDISTASYASLSYTPSEGSSSLKGMCFNSTQSKMWTISSGNNAVYQYTLSTPADVSTASYDTASYSKPNYSGNCEAIQANSDQSKMWTVGSTQRGIYEYTLATPASISTAAPSEPAAAASASGLAFFSAARRAANFILLNA